MTNKRTKGIYGYFDTLKCRIIYIGKDSNIEKKKRHKAHYQPSRYDDQPINRVLQNDKVGRYIYVEFDKGNYDDDVLNEKEIYWISYFEPKQNHTEGGDGSSGYKHTEEAKQKISDIHKNKIVTKETRRKISEALEGRTLTEEHCKKISETNTKGYARVVKDGFRSNGKQNYALIDKDGKVIKWSIFKDKLDKLADKLNEGLITVEEIKLKKKEARVIKGGINRGKQRYILMYGGKVIKRSINKDKLLKEMEKLNKNRGGEYYEF